MSLKNLQLEIGYLIPLVEAAPFFGVTPRTLRLMCDAGEIAHELRPGGGRSGNGRRYLIPESEIRAYRRTHTQPADGRRKRW